MIKYEDSDFEEFFFTEHPDVAIPIEIHQETNGLLTITTYRAAEEIARAYENCFSADPFSVEALKFLDNRLRPLAVAWGYRPDKRCESYILNYTADRAEQIRRSVILPESFLTHSIPENMKNKTTYDFEEKDNDFCAVICQDGCVVSIASVNSYDDFAEEREINTETAVAYRRNGFSASNTALLTLQLLKDGYHVTYNCNIRNSASRRVAEKCGFSFSGKSYYYICYLNE